LPPLWNHHIFFFECQSDHKLHVQTWKCRPTFVDRLYFYIWQRCQSNPGINIFLLPRLLEKKKSICRTDIGPAPNNFLQDLNFPLKNFFWRSEEKKEGTINSTFTEIIQAWEPVHKFIETCIVKILSLFQPRTSLGPALIKLTIWPTFFFVLCNFSLWLTLSFDVHCSSNWLSFPRLCSVHLQNVLRTTTFFIILRLFFRTGNYKILKFKRNRWWEQ
jgi:hypothetical protein